MALVMLNLVLSLAAVVIAYRFGELPEQQGAKIVSAMILVSYLGMLVFTRRYGTVDPVAFLVDMMSFLGFAHIGIYTKRVWPLWASSFQLISVGAHFVRALDLPVRPIVYAWMKSAPTWAVLLLLIGGSLVNRQRRAVSRQRLLTNLIGGNRDAAEHVAANLISAFGSVGGVLAASPSALAEVVNDPALINRFVAAKAVVMESLGEELRRARFDLSDRLVQLWVISLFRGRRTERVHFALLGDDLQMLWQESVSEGTLRNVEIGLERIISRGADVGASAVVLMHNHPSGDPQPSTADIDETARIAASLKHLGLRLHDHLIIAANMIFSMKGARMI